MRVDDSSNNLGSAEENVGTSLFHRLWAQRIVMRSQEEMVSTLMGFSLWLVYIVVQFQYLTISVSGQHVSVKAHYLGHAMKSPLGKFVLDREQK